MAQYFFSNNIKAIERAYQFSKDTKFQRDNIYRKEGSFAKMMVGMRARRALVEFSVLLFTEITEDI